MKKNVLSLAVAVLFITTAAFAQNTNYRNVRVLDSEVEKVGDKLNVDFTVDFENLNLSSNETFTVTPYISGVNDSMALPAIVFTGKTKRAPKGNYAYGTSVYGESYRTITVVNSSSCDREVDGISQIVNYDYSLDYRPWMEGAMVMLKEELSGCRTYTEDYVVALNQISNPADAMVMILTPEYEVTEVIREHLTAHVNFEQGKYVIKPALFNNEQELNEIVSVADHLFENDDLEIRNVEIKGFASPEGRYDFNTNLSKNRIDALREYVQQKVGGTSDMVKAEPMSEDWATLRNWLAETDSNIEHRNEIINIIDTTSDPDARDAKIRSLDNGRTYNMLLSEVYPSLRRVEFIVDFVEKPMTVEVARAMVLNNPQDLTIDHVYMVGQSYPKGSPEFEQVFVIAHQYHPNDPVVANNVAAVAMNKGDYATAKRHLERVANDPRCQNNLGVIGAWEGDHQKAEQHFRKAIEAGSSEAQYNLDNLASLRF